ncbi:MAG: hypothetical protein H6P99_2418 [Holophagaceae bacterium]|nr:hypothetical protein [Holophagaceae bacterium]
MRLNIKAAFYLSTFWLNFLVLDAPQPAVRHPDSEWARFPPWRLKVHAQWTILIGGCDSSDSPRPRVAMATARVQIGAMSR